MLVEIEINITVVNNTERNFHSHTKCVSDYNVLCIILEIST